MDDLVLYTRLVLHIITFGWLVSYRCGQTDRALVSFVAALLAGLSLAAAAHAVLMKPQDHQMTALIITAIGCIAIARSRGNLARVFR